MKNKRLLFIIVILIVLIGAIIFGVNSIIKSRKNYTLTQITNPNYYTLYKNGKVGIINTKGETVIKPEYNYIQLPNPEKAVFICSNSDKTVILNENGQEIFNNYDEVTAISVTGTIGDIPFEKAILRYKQNGLYGLINLDGKVITKPIYEKVESVPYKEGELLVQKDGKQGVINAKGVELVKIKYDSIVGDGYYNQVDYKEAGYIVGIKQENKILYGYLNNQGREVLKNEYDEISRLTNTKDKNVCLITTQNGKKGLVKNNKEVLENIYDQMEYDSTIELVKVKKDELYGICNLDGNVILNTEYKEISYKGIYIQATNKASKIVNFDRSGNEQKENNYKKVIATENPKYFITVGQNNLYGIINENGVETTTNKYTYIEYLQGEYFSAYNEDNQIGIIDHYGNIVLGIQYNLVQKIKGTEMIQVSDNSKGVLEVYSSDIKQVAIMKNAKLYTAENYIKIVSDTETKYISLDGKIITNKQALPNNTLFATSKYGLWGFEDKDGKVVVNQVYDMVTEFNRYGFAGIKEGNKWGVIREDGTVIVAPTYEISSNIEPEFIGKYHKINYGGVSYFTDDKIE